MFFDKDGHPKAKEAFEMARITERSMEKDQYSLSSRCLVLFTLHLNLYTELSKIRMQREKLLQGKKKSKTVSYYCMTDRAVEAKNFVMAMYVLTVTQG